jgi:hypothetical protein
MHDRREPPLAMKEATVEYLPRDQFQPFHRRRQRWSIIMAHRRAGETVATINDLIRRALRDKKPDGRYSAGTMHTEAN